MGQTERGVCLKGLWLECYLNGPLPLRLVFIGFEPKVAQNVDIN